MSPLAGTKHMYVRLAIIIRCQILALFSSFPSSRTTVKVWEDFSILIRFHLMSSLPKTNLRSEDSGNVTGLRPNKIPGWIVLVRENFGSLPVSGNCIVFYCVMKKIERVSMKVYETR